MPGHTMRSFPDATAIAHAPERSWVSELSAVVPVHDEEGAVATVLESLLGVLPRVSGRWEIVVVDDGSTDGTATVLETLARAEPRIRTVRHPANRGYGAALRSGFAAARYDLVFVTDGDGQLDPAQLPDAVAALGGADGVVGYRARRSDSLRRRVNTALWNRVVGGLLGVPVRDLNCAFKLLPREVLVSAPLLTTGAAISAEILVRAVRGGYRLAEIPVTHHARRAGRASGGRADVVLRAAWELPRLYWQLRREPAG